MLNNCKRAASYLVSITGDGKDLYKLQLIEQASKIHEEKNPQFLKVFNCLKDYILCSM